MKSLYARFKNLIDNTDIKIIWTNLDENGKLKVCLKCDGEEVIGEVIEDKYGVINFI